ncbi:hypothetical protein PLICRDRAFT_188292 [Plicaturopsis crispa FD-325 SS-3]|nr:hypothetical protein PLICRDRAFT_188292 [Plicaturopsis crispa FD-325 SS-3]
MSGSNLGPIEESDMSDISGTGSVGAAEDDSEEEFVYPGAAEGRSNGDEGHIITHAAVPHHPSPAQLESLYAAASSGDLSLLKKLFTTALRTGDVEAFALSNDASSRTGFTALHAAASRGYLDIVKWRMCHIYPCSP